MYQYFFS